MKKILVLAVLFLINLNFVLGDVVLSEVMYNPSYCSDLKCEWVEIYNNGSVAENLENWTLNGKNFDDFIIQPEEFAVIAKSLAGYEEFFGNNDTLWSVEDGDYVVVDGYFSLSNSGGVVNLSDGYFEDVFYYNDSFGADGNGKTLQKINLNSGNFRENWNESEEGTPGRFYVQEVETNISNSLTVHVEVANAAPVIESINITDDSDEPGVQILPEPGMNKTISLYVDVSDVNGYDDITGIVVLFNSLNIELDFLESLAEDKARYNTTLFLPFSSEAGNYIVNVTATDSLAQEDKASVSFEYLRLLSIGIDTSNLDFLSLMPGSESAPKQFFLINKGNVPINVDVLGTDLSNGETVIDSTSIKLSRGLEDFLIAKTPQQIISSVSFGPDAQYELDFSVRLPYGLKADSYSGTVSFIGYGE